MIFFGRFRIDGKIFMRTLISANHIVVVILSRTIVHILDCW